MFQDSGQGLDVVHGQPQRRDFGPLFTAAGRTAAARRAAGRRRRRRSVGRRRRAGGRRRNGPSQSFERLVDLLHAGSLAGVGRLPPVLAQRRRLLLWLRRPFGQHGLLELLFHLETLGDGARSQAVLFALHRHQVPLAEIVTIHGLRLSCIQQSLSQLGIVVTCPHTIVAARCLTVLYPVSLFTLK